MSGTETGSQGGFEYVGVYPDAGAMFEIACKAKGQINVRALPNLGHQPEALVAIVFSAISLETFANEFPKLLHSFAKTESNALLLSQMDIAEESRASIPKKLGLIRQLLSGSPTDYGTEPFQSVKLLFETRNEIAHRKPQDFSVDLAGKSLVGMDLTKSLINGLKSRNLLSFSTQTEESWIFTECVATFAAAEWACNTVVDVLKSLYDSCTIDTASRRKLLLAYYIDTYKEVLSLPQDGHFIGCGLPEIQS